MSLKIDAILKDVFGYDGFRHSQRKIINALIAGQDCLVLMPTGGGKSLCYQIPALSQNRLGVVISPLIALMHDQVEALLQLGVAAAYLNSSQDYNQRREVFQKINRGALKLLYLSPERLLMADTLELLKRLDISLFAIDEAHCVSQWGHDFRKEYKQLDCLPTLFPKVPRVALTATADKQVRNEIIAQLHLENAAQFVHSFNRPNICYQVVDANNPKQQLWQFLSSQHPDDAGIVYCLSRKRVQEIADFLNHQGRTALIYHAGLVGQKRRHNQRRFLLEDGLIMVATVAFGMGIDKPNVRFVAHLNLPKNLESYYQESGRAGRDGLPANAWMTYSLQDVITLGAFVEDSDAAVAHKKRMRHKLDIMLGWCEATTCRRTALLNYFNEVVEADCGNCDNCLTPPDVFDNTENAQRALSCVYRTGQRFGVNYLLQVLQGKVGDPRVTKNRHDKLELFGAAKNTDTRQWRDLFRQLIASGFLILDDAGHGGLRLAACCRPVLRGQQKVRQRRHIRAPAKAAKKPSATLLNPKDEQLFAALRELRAGIAKQHGVPSYVIFHDTTLIALATDKPLNYQDLTNISGIGQTKQQRYGKAFIGVIRGFLDRQ